MSDKIKLLIKRLEQIEITSLPYEANICTVTDCGRELSVVGEKNLKPNQLESYCFGCPFESEDILKETIIELKKLLKKG